MPFKKMGIAARGEDHHGHHRQVKGLAHSR